jgi:ribonuclease I
MGKISRILGVGLLVGWGATVPALAEDWVLALSWAPGFCAGHPDKEQCRRLGRQGDAEADYARRHLTLHGLWPQRQDCAAPALRATDLPAELPHYMPGVADGLAQHEWSKHGSCSGYTARGYFDQMIAMARQVSDSPLGRYLTAHAGERVALAALHRATQPQPPICRASDALPVRFICRGEQLTEVRFSLPDWSQTLGGKAPDTAKRPATDADRCDESVLL